MSKYLSQKFVITKKCAERWDLFTVSCFYKAIFWELQLLFITKCPLSDLNSILGGQHFKLHDYNLLHGDAGRNSL
jgi:hypothetical protein